MDKAASPKRRWSIAFMICAGLLGLNIIWFSPSPILNIIIGDLGVSMMQGGLLISIVCLTVASYGIVEARLAGRVGLKHMYSIGLWVMGIGAAVTIGVDSFSEMLLSRIVVGVGFGICIPVSGALIMDWFPVKERPLINTIISVLPYIATFISFGMTIPLYFYLNESWRMTLSVSGLFVLIVAVFWNILGAQRHSKPMDSYQKGVEITEILYLKVFRNRDVRLLCIAEMGDMWSFQFLTTFLPTYFVLNEGMDMKTASSLTVFFPAAGVVGGLICGFVMTKVGLRKPFTWPMHLMIFFGTVLAIQSEGYLRIIGIVMAGFGNAGWAPALYTIPMELANMTPSKVATTYSVLFSLGFISAFMSPWFGGWLMQWYSLHDIIFTFSFSSLIAAFCMFRIKETGSKRNSQLLLTNKKINKLF